MLKIKIIAFVLIFFAYVLFSFLPFPEYNINAAIPFGVVCGIGAWLFGTFWGLVIVLASILYHSYLFDYYGDILATYQAKAFGTCAPTVIALLTGNVKEQQDRVKQLSVQLDRKVTERTVSLNKLILELITDDENIRRNLGQDIHDGLGQNLTGLLLLSSSLQNEMKTTNSCELHRADELVNFAQKTLYMARKVSRTLFPFKVMEVGLDAALDELTSYFMETTTIRFEIKLDGTEQTLSYAVVIHLYRIVYESILNVLHHKHPHFISVDLCSEEDELCLTIRIDGFDDAHEICGNIFIDLMKYRANLIDGTLGITVSPSNQITIECKAPLSCHEGLKASKTQSHV